MAVGVSDRRPVAHLPLILGMLRKLEIATVIDALLPPHPDTLLSCGRRVEALVLVILDGHHALYKVGQRLEERGLVPLLQLGLQRASLNDYLAQGELWHAERGGLALCRKHADRGSDSEATAAQRLGVPDRRV